jgi:hypothetical protein
MPVVVVSEEIVDLGIVPEELQGIVDPLVWFHLRHCLLVSPYAEIFDSIMIRFYLPVLCYSRRMTYRVH